MSHRGFNAGIIPLAFGFWSDMKTRNKTLTAVFISTVLVCCACSGNDGATTGPPPIVAVNEVVAKAVMDGPDWVELYNPGSSAVDMTGWILRDGKNSHEFEFPEGTTIEPGVFIVIQGSGGSGTYVADYGFGATDAARLYDAFGELVDGALWMNGDAPKGTSWGRYPDGNGTYATLVTPTPGEFNSDPL